VRPRALTAAALADLAIAASAMALAVAGWKLFWFLTDDAYIAFRYVANSLAGRGLVWNPAPFHPVEGYTSFLWVVLLRAVWSGFGVEPPASANVLSLVCGLGQLALAMLWLRRLPLPASMERARRPLAALALLGIVTNRTFLAWMSSGLETALFNVLLFWWATETALPESPFAAPRAGRDEPRPGRQCRAAVAAALLALARPDGMLAVLATAALFAVRWIGGPASAGRSRRGPPLAALPLLVPVVHLLWRRGFYGDWLPNTYHAKHVAAWPTMGAAYATSFVLEYGLLVWIALAYVAVRRALLDPLRPPLLATLRGHAAGAAVTAVLLLHAAYYTLVIGGDHFEYRVYSQLVPVLFVSAAWLAARVVRRPTGAVLALLAFLLASWPIPWAHWALTHRLTTRDETHRLAEPLAPHTPRLLRPPVALWDMLQLSMINHDVGSRHQEHKVYCETRRRLLPERSAGAAIPWDDRPVAASGFVGLLGWSLPNVAILDLLGLNDRVVARTETAVPNAERHMAHDRHPPAGYVECFRPNVTIANAQATAAPRAVPLTDAEIRACDDPGRWLGDRP